MNVCGIDTHTTYQVVVVLDSLGEVVEGPTRIANKDEGRLLEVLERNRPVEIVVETAPTWPWLYELIRECEGIEFVLAHASRVRAIADSTYKFDEIDAELLARMRLAGLIPEVYPKTLELREQALLVRHRQTLVQLRTAAANRVHAQLHAIGLRLPRGRLLTQSGRSGLCEQAWPLWGVEQRRLAETHFELIDQLTGMINDIDRQVEAVARAVPAARLLQSIPGIGAYRSLVIATETEPIERFHKASHLVSYAGLAPRTQRSGLGPIRHGHIPAGANRWLRGAFVRAVVSHCQFAPNSWLSRYYERQKERIGWQVARIASARKLARATHAMLRTGELWRGEQEQSAVGESSS